MSLLGAFVDVVAHVHIVLRLGYLSIMRMLQEYIEQTALYIKINKVVCF